LRPPAVIASMSLPTARLHKVSPTRRKRLVVFQYNINRPLYFNEIVPYDKSRAATHENNFNRELLDVAASSSKMSADKLQIVT
jgi:hypothetical protein